MTRPLARTVAAAFVLLLLSQVIVRTGRAQERLSGPRDWSYRHVVAARSGPDGDRNIPRNWRTRAAHAQIDASLGSRDYFQDWLDRFTNRARKPKNQPAHLDWSLRTGGFGNVIGDPAMTSSFAPAEGVTSGIITDTRTTAMTGSTATANIYFGTAGSHL